jgi:hypothetical protein
VVKIKHTRNQKWPKLNTLETKMAKISHTKIKQGSFGKKKANINLHKNFPIYGTRNIKILRQTTITHSFKRRGCHGRDRMVLGFTTTYTISAYHYLSCEL